MSEERCRRSGGSTGSRQSLREIGIGAEAVRQLDPVLQAKELSTAEMLKGKGKRKKDQQDQPIMECDEEDHDRCGPCCMVH